MRDPKKCGVFNPNTNEQCGYPKVSKLKGKQGTVFEPAFLGELCTRHGRDYLERKPLKYIEGVDPPAATESIAGDWEEPPTEGAFESVEEAYVPSRSASASAPTIHEYYYEEHEPVDVSMSAPAMMIHPTASGAPNTGQSPGASSEEIGEKIIRVLESIDRDQKATHLRLAVIEQFHRQNLVEQHQSTKDAVADVSARIAGLEECIQGDTTSTLSSDGLVTEKLQELSKLCKELRERQQQGFKAVAAQISELQQRGSAEATSSKETITNLTKLVEGLKCTVKEKGDEEAKANKMYRDSLLQRIEDQVK
ncbi:MAG: hypothetical protein LQ337_004406 [Flavoplaca oasis]|nr:MAG: hypothetical protein LQ337_004406 [Flavoplaca oasis]